MPLLVSVLFWQPYLCLFLTNFFKLLAQSSIVMCIYFTFTYMYLCAHLLSCVWIKYRPMESSWSCFKPDRCWLWCPSHCGVYGIQTPRASLATRSRKENDSPSTKVLRSMEVSWLRRKDTGDLEHCETVNRFHHRRMWVGTCSYMYS